MSDDGKALAGMPVDAVRDEYRRRGLEAWSDARLVAAVGDTMSRPIAQQRDGEYSFVLHAPLELLARSGLLKHVRPEHRADARLRLTWLAARYDGAGDAAPSPPSVAPASIDEAFTALLAALARRAGDQVDGLAVWLAANACPADLAGRLAAVAAPSLAAAAHAPILLYLLPRTAAGGEISAGIMRRALGELAGQPDLRLTWFERVEPGAPTRDLLAVLLDVPRLGAARGLSIHAIMSQAEDGGFAARVLGDPGAFAGEVAAARRTLTRIAAWSMLQEPGDHAPYGWSHCLTLPQAVMGLCDHGLAPRLAVAVAATQSLGFRAAMGTRALTPGYSPAAPATRDLGAAIAAGQAAAAAAAWHAAAADEHAVIEELATRAALHHDAHLAKYTLACLDAAAADRAERRLYLAAAASLSAWWAAKPADALFA